MDNIMAPPSKRRKLLDAAEVPAEASESARTFIAPFSHGVEHIPASQPTQAPIARSPPHHVEEVHLQIHKRSILSAEDRLRLLKRQGTAALTDIIKTNSDADVVVAVTASADALGSTTALATAAVTVDLPDVGSLLSTSSSTTVISESSPRPTSSTSPASSAEPSSSERSSPSQTASSSDDSRSSSMRSSTTESRSSTLTSSGSQQTYAISPASENSDDGPQSQSHSSTSTRSSSTKSVTGSSSALSSTATDGSESSTASSSLSSQIASLSAYASSNSSMLATSSGSSASAVTSGYLSSTGSSSIANSLNLTTSASTSTSGSAVLVSVVTVSSTSSSDSQATDSNSSIDLNALYLATQSNGDVTTITKSDEPFTTSLADGQAATIPASSSGSVTVISSDGSTVRLTVFSTASPSPTQSSSSSSDDSNGVGLAGVAGDGATATSGSISSTSAPAKSNGDDTTAPAGTIAGGVVGGAAGLVLVGLIVLLFLRRYKKRVQLGHQALPANTAGPLAGSDAGTSSSGPPGMAERAGLMPFAGAVPALFRHQNRQNGAETGERGFQRVSGRKLPSAFSEGMAGPPQPPTSPPPTMPLVSPEEREGNVSGLSFYRDSAGFYGGDGSSPSPNPFSDTNLPATVARNEAAEQLIMSPGPQRRPTIHAAKSNVQAPSVATSGTPSWTPSHTATFARSDTPASLDSGRNSRFTEEV